MAIEDDINNFLSQYVCPDYIQGVPNIAITGGTAAVGYLLLKGKGIGGIIGLAGIAGTAAVGYAKYVKNLC